MAMSLYEYIVGKAYRVLLQHTIQFLQRKFYIFSYTLSDHVYCMAPLYGSLIKFNILSFQKEFNTKLASLLFD